MTTSKTENTQPPGSSGLHAAIADVMATLERLQETGVNKHQGYRYVTEADIFDAVRQELGKRGVTLVQDHGTIVSERDLTTSGGNAMHEAVVQFTFHLVHAPSNERERYTFLGVGADTGDKWYTKASTSAAKFFVRRLFLISAGSDEDPDGGGYDRGASGTTSSGGQRRDGATGYGSEKQLNRLWTIANKNNATRVEVRRLIWACTNGRTFHSDELKNKVEYDTICGALDGWSDSYTDNMAKLAAFEQRVPPPPDIVGDLPDDETAPADPPPPAAPSDADDIPF